MEVNRVVDRSLVSVAEAHLARVADEGSSRHPHLCALLADQGPEGARNLADAVHLLCSLHGRHPGLVELVSNRAPSESAKEWLARAADGLERERLYLLRLTAAVGPLPSTPAAAQTESSLLAQRNALEILASSERQGCPLGAACALVGDWWPIRRLLDRAAARVGIDPPPTSLPDEESILTVVGDASRTASAARAFSFGAEQLLLQHRALFDLLEARAEARADC
jgi:hypothetical protein